ncbi:MAG: AI-2E family transporter, partial [Actinobacteria bacterium]|nr:AI-2E family transporter [Actinomycetota bacterium]
MSDPGAPPPPGGRTNDSPRPEPVPVRTIMVSIGVVVAAALGLYLVVALARVETLLVIAAFLAVAFTPPVNFVRRHLHLSQGPAVLVVLVISVALTGGILYAFISPVVHQGGRFANDFPTYLSDAEAGRGPLGGVVKKYELDKRYEQNKAKISQSLRRATGGAVGVARSVLASVVSLLTITVLAILMTIYGPEVLMGGLGVLPPDKRRRVVVVATDCARAVTGYVTGNLLISLIAATVTYVALWIFGVPFRFLLALWVAFTDILPLIGATLGAIPTIGIALLHSTTAGIGMAIVYFVYQQLENNVLSVVIMSKTIQINQLLALVSVLVGAELFGVVGALLGLPAAGMIQVVVRDLWDHRSGQLKAEPTVG